MTRALALLCYGTVLVAGAIVAGYGLTISFALEREVFWVRGLGWITLAALLGAFSMSPLARALSLLRRERAAAMLATVRRALGICAAALACVHGTTAFVTYLGASPALTWSLPWARSGVVALAILIALWITSYPRMVRVLHVRLWKPLHRLSYAAGLLAAHHALLAPFAPRLLIAILFACALALGLLRALPRRRER